MAEKEGQPFIKGGVKLFEWRLDAPLEDIFEEGVTSAEEHEVFIEDVFEFPDDDVDADPSDDVENGLDEVGNDTPGDNFIDINNHDVANANEADDPAEFEPDGLEPGTNDEDGADTGVEDVFDHDQRSVEPEANKNSNTNRYNLRSDRGRTYENRLAHQMGTS